MKRILILALTVLMLAAVFTACGTTAYVDDPYRGYSNVSTTRDGTVNGTNGYAYGYNGAYANGYNGTYAGGTTGTNGYGNGGATGYANGNAAVGNGTTTTTTTGTTRSGITNGTTTGTGMAGGR